MLREFAKCPIVIPDALEVPKEVTEYKTYFNNFRRLRHTNKTVIVDVVQFEDVRQLLLLITVGQYTYSS